MVDMPPLRPLPLGSVRNRGPSNAQAVPRSANSEPATISLFQTLPAMDVAKVAAIKAAIAAGTLTISPLRIAQAILADRAKAWM